MSATRCQVAQSRSHDDALARGDVERRLAHGPVQQLAHAVQRHAQLGHLALLGLAVRGLGVVVARVRREAAAARGRERLGRHGHREGASSARRRIRERSERRRRALQSGGGARDAVELSRQHERRRRVFKLVVERAAVAAVCDEHGVFLSCSRHRRCVFVEEHETHGLGRVQHHLLHLVERQFLHREAADELELAADAQLRRVLDLVHEDRTRLALALEREAERRRAVPQDLGRARHALTRVCFFRDADGQAAARRRRRRHLVGHALRAHSVIRSKIFGSFPQLRNGGSGASARKTPLLAQREKRKWAHAEAADVCARAFKSGALAAGARRQQLKLCACAKAIVWGSKSSAVMGRATLKVQPYDIPEPAAR